MIPDFQTAMRPALEQLASGETLRTREVVERCARHFHVSEEEREQLLPSGRARTFDNRVGWAITYLFKAGLIERPQRAHLKITDLGRNALTAHPDRIDMKVLEQFPAYVEFRDQARQSGAEASPALPVDAVSTPQDLLERALKENRAVVENDLLKSAVALLPVGFEDLVLRLLAAMGYGHAGRVERASTTGDAGIDGIISQDPLGLDRIYVQAKCYGLDKVVHRPAIQSFVGAVMGAQGDRGVFITTSSFSQGAREEAARVPFRIELIDGPRLASLMLAHRVGVQESTSVTLFELDEDYFESM